MEQTLKSLLTPAILAALASWASGALARAAALGLRDDLAALRTRLATAPGATCINAAAALGDVLQQCSDDYRALAETADRHVSDIRTLREAWPK